MAVLDMRKAFDTVWHNNGLFYTQHQAGVTDGLWFLLHEWYSQSSCSVVWNTQSSRVINIKQGVKQGGILSPFLYVNDLLSGLNDSEFGLCACWRHLY